MDADIYAASIMLAASLTALATWAPGAIRRHRDRKNSITTPAPAAEAGPAVEQRTLTSIDFTVAGTTYTFTTDHPIQPADLQAAFTCLARSHGPLHAHLGIRSLIDAVVTREADSLDADLANLTADGGES